MYKYFSAVLLTSFMVITGLHGNSGEEAYQYLDRLALQAGSDKASSFHNYTKVYAKYFECFRDESIKFLEIGAWKGASIQLWEEYFPKAELHFVDWDYSNLIYRPKRASLHLADQSNQSHLNALMQKTGGGFDVILDDGGHTMLQQKVSFTTLFPFLKSGGLYIIEDLHTSYWSNYGGGGNLLKPAASFQSTTEFLKTLIDDVNFVGARTGRASHDVNLNHIKDQLSEYREQIFSLHFYDSVCIIIKK